jgi:hypothetical protein
MMSVRLQLKVARVQFQPGPAIAFGVNPVGKTSVTVMVPLVGAPETLFTVTV